MSSVDVREAPLLDSVNGTDPGLRSSVHKTRLKTLFLVKRAIALMLSMIYLSEISMIREHFRRSRSFERKALQKRAEEPPVL